jgi:hypothetical protein
MVGEVTDYTSYSRGLLVMCRFVLLRRLRIQYSDRAKGFSLITLVIVVTWTVKSIWRHFINMSVNDRSYMSLEPSMHDANCKLSTYIKLNIFIMEYRLQSNVILMLQIWEHWCWRKWDSSVSIVTKLRARRPSIRRPFVPAGARVFSLPHSVQTCSVAHPHSYPLATCGCLPGGKAVGKWNCPLSASIADIKNCGDILPLLHTSPWHDS